MNIVTSGPDSVRTGMDPETTADGRSWQWHVKHAIRDVPTLLRRLGLPSDPSLATAGTRVAVEGFPLFVPLPFLERMESGNPADPLLLQVLPVEAEDVSVDGFLPDAVGDLAALRAGGLIHKYQGRALLMPTGVCAVHCRYCFRRHFPYETVANSESRWQEALEILRSDRSIQEVILSGGDPLMLVDSQLKIVLSELQEIRHLRRIRIHTRLPVVIPQRASEDLLALFAGRKTTMVMVLHINHPNEIDVAVARAMKDLAGTGIQLLNQSVLLRGVNDDESALRELSERLVENRCLPYYLHQLDRVAGAAHFEVPISRGLELMRSLREHLPGYAVPRYVEEIAGEASKRWIE